MINPLGPLKNAGSVLGEILARKQLNELRDQNIKLHQKLTSAHEKLRDSYESQTDLSVEHGELRLKQAATAHAYQQVAKTASALKKKVELQDEAIKQLRSQIKQQEDLHKGLPPPTKPSPTDGGR